MQRQFVILGLFLLVGFNALPQQNLFNIPSGDVTAKGKFFYQHQLNLYRNKVESKAHFVYGLGQGWDAGINLVGKGFYFSPEWRALYNSNKDKGSLYPIVMGTVQKQWKLSSRLNINAGLQAGYNLTNSLRDKEVNYYSYALGVYHFGKGSRVVAGGYHGNRMFLGGGNTTGAMLGYEIKLHKRWYLMGDWVSGNNDAGVAVVGGMFNAGKRTQLCIGWQVPNSRALKPHGLVLELNITGWDVF
jgi:hypothetical protein